MPGHTPLDFLEIHALHHKFSSEVFSIAERMDFAARALALMDKYRALHPRNAQFTEFLRSNGHPDALKFGDEWAASIKHAPAPKSLSGEGGKLKTLDEFCNIFRSQFIRGDFASLYVSLGELISSIQLLNHCTKRSSFVKNRYFEIALYQIIATVYDQLWFPQGRDVGSAETVLRWTQIEKKCDNYHARSQQILSGPGDDYDDREAHPETELACYHLVKWFCAFAKFKENRWVEFAADFGTLQSHLHLLAEPNLQSEALVMYAIASIATVPFEDLSLAKNEALLALYTSPNTPESEAFRLLEQLSCARFPEAKQLLAEPLLAYLTAHVAFVFGKSSPAAFWEYLASLIDMKVFLLVLSFSSCIPRSKVLAKMGYHDAVPATRDSVSNQMVLLISALGLSSSGIYYNQQEDNFYHLPVSSSQREEELDEAIAEVDHRVRADAAAAQMKALLVGKYFS